MTNLPIIRAPVLKISGGRTAEVFISNLLLRTRGLNLVERLSAWSDKKEKIPFGQDFKPFQNNSLFELTGKFSEDHEVKPSDYKKDVPKPNSLVNRRGYSTILKNIWQGNQGPEKSAPSRGSDKNQQLKTKPKKSRINKIEQSGLKKSVISPDMAGKIKAVKEILKLEKQADADLLNQLLKSHPEQTTITQSRSQTGRGEVVTYPKKRRSVEIRRPEKKAIPIIPTEPQATQRLARKLVHAAKDLLHKNKSTQIIKVQEEQKRKPPFVHDSALMSQLQLSVPGFQVDRQILINSISNKKENPGNESVTQSADGTEFLDESQLAAETLLSAKVTENHQIANDNQIPLPPLIVEEKLASIFAKDRKRAPLPLSNGKSKETTRQTIRGEKEDEDLNNLAEKIKYILEEEARRFGINV